MYAKTDREKFSEEQIYIILKYLPTLAILLKYSGHGLAILTRDYSIFMFLPVCPVKNDTNYKLERQT